MSAAAAGPAPAPAPTPAAAPRRLAAILKGLCPLCRVGHVFRGLLRMNERCPSCGTPFSREPGYFSGAMYFSYLLAIGVILILFLILFVILRGWRFSRILIASGILFLPFIPAIFRYSRILWIHFDRYFEP